MKKLILIRHSKSSWEYNINDFDRPLSKIGIEKAIKVAKKAQNLVSNECVIWSSSAIRAHQTSTIMVECWELNPNNIIVKDNLYTFEINKLEQIVKSCLNNCQNLILFAHNSAITDFVNKFGDIYIDNVPTAGLVSIIFKTENWKDIEKGKINKIILPREI